MQLVPTDDRLKCSNGDVQEDEINFPRTSRADDSPTSLNQVIISLFDGPLQENPNWEIFLKKIRDFFRSCQAVLIFRVPVKDGFNTRVIIGADHPLTEYEQTYENSFFALDPLTNLQKDEAFTVDDFIESNEWIESNFYKNFLSPMNVFHVLASDMLTENGIDCRIRICRPETKKNFSDEDKVNLKLLLPHIKRCVQLHVLIHQVISTNQLLESTFDKLMFGIVLLDQKGAILSTNSIADELIEAFTGLIVSHGFMRAKSRDEDRILQKLISEALKDREEHRPVIAKGMAITSGEHGHAISIVVRSLPSCPWAEGERHASVAILIRDPGHASSPTVASLRRLYSFTAAESQLALLLAEGLTLDQASERLNISRNTARTQLRSLFWKTGTSRQSDFIRTVMGSVAPLFDS